MHCPGCGSSNPDGAKFCAFCGKPIPEPKKTAPEPDAYARFKRPANDRAEKPAPTAAPSRGNVVSGSGVTAREPRRAAPIRPARAARVRPDTLIPRKRQREDLFFEDMDLPEERVRDEYEDAGAVAHRIRSGIAGVVLLAILCFVFWLMVLPGGQAFKASLGMGNSASAYARLGQQYLEENSMRRAAEAYYDALRLEPDNYDYALMVAKTQSLIGERTKALAAYAKCITLKPDAVEPYAQVAQIYQQMGETDRMVDVLSQGFEKTGDLELLRSMQEVVKEQN